MCKGPLLGLHTITDVRTSEPNSFQHPMPSLYEGPGPLNSQFDQLSQSALPFVVPEGHHTSCVVCAEDFSPSRRPPSWISKTCQHQPSTCMKCVARCISNDLDSKIWNQIKCPECDATLIYEDIKRLADPHTFAR